MTIQEMHYDFKLKYNKNDSAQNRNFIIPEIDWFLNSAQELFVKSIAEPRMSKKIGFEINQRNTDDLSPIVKTLPITIGDGIVTLPNDYWFYLDGFAFLENKNFADTPAQKASIIIRQHDDDFQNNFFNKSSWEWREINAVFEQKGLILYLPTDTLCRTVTLTYLQKLPYIHFASGFRTGSYKKPGSTITLSGTLDSILPESTHREIVDLAVYIAANNLKTEEYQHKIEKLSKNNLNN